MGSPDITPEDKRALIKKNVYKTAKKGTIERLLAYGEDKISTLFSIIEPVRYFRK